MIRNAELQFCLDTLVLETLLFSSPMVKNAESGLISSLIEKVKDYVLSHIDQNNKLVSVLDLLAPGILAVLGFPIIGFIVMLAENFFGFSIGNIFTGIVSKVKGLISGNDKQTNSQEVDSAVESVVKENYGVDPTEGDLSKFDIKASLKDVQFVKLAYHLNKEAGIGDSLLKLIGLKGKVGSILGSILKWIVKVVLAAGGFMVAGDVTNKLLGTTKADPTPSGMPTLSPTHNKQVSFIPHTSSQNLFKTNPNYNEEKLNVNRGWIEAVPPSKIGDQIVNWTEEIYPDLANMTNFIKGSSKFQKVVSDIQEANSTNTSNITFMPTMLTSRKKVVDLFIDDLANKAKSLPNVPKSNTFNYISSKD